MKEVCAQLVRDLFIYDPRSGLFTYRTSHHQRPDLVGATAGAKNSEGYVHIQIEGRKYKAHRLAFLYMTGEWPSSRVDHRNRVKSDNRWENLRLASHSQNIANSVVRNDNKSGVKGVHFQKDMGKWIAYISHNKRRVHLGTFASKSDAEAARRAAAQQLHGEFATI